MNLMLAAISGNALVTVLVTLVVAGLIYFVVTWGLDKLALAEPFNKVARVIVILIVVVLICNALLGLIGRPFISW